MGTSVPGSTPNTTTTQTGGGANPTPATNPSGTEVVETGNGQPNTSGGSTTPPGLAGQTTVQQPDPNATGVANQSSAPQPGTGTTPAASDSDVQNLQRAVQAPGENASTHVLVANSDVNVIRRLWSDAERGVEGAWDRLRTALGHVFG
jgi:hypothetical protein